jgi:hypothetical protein
VFCVCQLLFTTFLVLIQPREYDVRPGLVQNVIRAFFTMLWDKNEPMGKKLRLVELDGVNQEKAVVKITTGR